MIEPYVTTCAAFDRAKPPSPVRPESTNPGREYVLTSTNVARYGGSDFLVWTWELRRIAP